MKQLNLSLPNWVDSFLNKQASIIPEPEDQMRFVLALTERNIREETGGPFGSAVFEIESLILFSFFFFFFFHLLFSSSLS